MRGGREKRNGEKGHAARASETGLLLKLELKSNPEALCVVRATVERAAEVLHFPDAATRAIVRSVDEALANVLEHAYHGRPGHRIEVYCNKLEGRGKTGASEGIEILLQDEGVASNPAKFKGRALADVKPGGLGLHFIQQSMDVVEFSRRKGKNQLRLVKYLSPAAKAVGSQGE